MKNDKRIQEMRDIITSLRRHATGQDVLSKKEIDSLFEREMTIHAHYEPAPLTPVQEHRQGLQPGYDWRQVEDATTRAIFYILQGNVGGVLSAITDAHKDYPVTVTDQLWKTWAKIDGPSYE